MCVYLLNYSNLGTVSMAITILNCTNNGLCLEILIYVIILSRIYL